MNGMIYDLLVVGSGLYGAVVAQQAKEWGLRVLVLERRKEIGGNIRDEWQGDICVHRYGAHIFHTDNAEVWRYVNRFARFVPYRHEVLSRSGDRLYHLPFSMTTMNEVFGVSTASELRKVMRREHERESYTHPENLEQQAVNLVGRTVYELLIKGYTEKQWGRKATELPADIIRRLPIRTTWDTNYFDDRYQGIPEQGYSAMIAEMLSGIEVRPGVDFRHERDHWLRRARRTIYTGAVDELMNYRLGTLDYRSLRFETETIATSQYQPCAVVNEASADVPYTRTIEHRHFQPPPNLPPKGRLTDHPIPPSLPQKGEEFRRSGSQTIITREYPTAWHRGEEAYYPVNNDRNNRLYREYQELIAQTYPSIILGGRLGLYRYMDMDDAVEAALNVVCS